jgi:protein-disulfide isomerase
MNRNTFRRIAWGVIAAPFCLALAACGGSDDSGGGAKSGEPIARIAPPAGKAWSDVVAKTAEGGYRMGNPEAPIRIVEFGALSCSHCAEFSAQSSTELRDTFVASGRVSYELRLFMLNALDMPAALLVTCGAPEAVPTLAEQFWAWQPTMFENLQSAPQAQMQAIDSQPPQQRIASLARVTGMEKFVNSRGIAADQAAACLADMKRVEELANQTETASKEFEITGTPTFLVNGAKTDVKSWPDLKARLETMGAR